MAHTLVSFPSSDPCVCGACFIRTSLRFVLGNPGLLDFYVPFLNAIYRSVNSSSDPPSSSESSPSRRPSESSASAGLTIFAHSHLGLSSYIPVGIGDGHSDKPNQEPKRKSYYSWPTLPVASWPETSSVALRAQIQAHLEFLDELLVAYDDGSTTGTTRVLLVGHSIGCWLIQEMLKARAAGSATLRPRVGVFMLFPTISHIAQSPNGRKLSVRISPTPLSPYIYTPLLTLANAPPTARLSPSVASSFSFARLGHEQ